MACYAAQYARHVDVAEYACGVCKGLRRHSLATGSVWGATLATLAF